MGIQMTYSKGTLEGFLNQTGAKAMRGISNVMRQAAVRIRDLARDYAPIKTGLLQNSIDYMTIRDGNRRNSYVVYVDMEATKMISKGKIRELGEYAFLMHEGLSPYGSGRYKLGEKSATKRAGGKKVGGRFLTRAMTDGLNSILGPAAREVRRVTQGAYANFDSQEDLL